MKVYWIANTENVNHWGSRAASVALRTMIEEFGGTIIGTTYLTKFNFNPDTDPFYPVDLADFKNKESNFLNDGPLSEEYSLIQECDVVIIHGEGSIYDRQQKARATYFYAWMAKKIGKPCILVNHGVDLHDDILAEMAEAIYPTLDDVLFRDPMSPNERLGSSGKILKDVLKRETAEDCISSDSVYAFNPMPCTQCEQPQVAMSGSSIYYHPDRPGSDPIPAYKKIIEGLNDIHSPGYDKKTTASFICTCPVDEIVAVATAKTMRIPPRIIPTSTYFRSGMNSLSASVLHVSGRWHSSIFATMGGSPCCMFTANTKKSEAFLETMPYKGKVFDGYNLMEHVDEIIELGKSYIERGEDLGHKIRMRQKELQKLSLKNCRWIAKKNGIDYNSMSERVAESANINAAKIHEHYLKQK